MYTDHRSLLWLQSLRNPEGQLARWLERIAPFDFDVVYTPGKENRVADLLSRRPCATECKYCAKRENELIDVKHFQLNQNDDQWIADQGQDPDICKLKGWLQDKERPRWETVALESSRLKA